MMPAGWRPDLGAGAPHQPDSRPGDRRRPPREIPPAEIGAAGLITVSLQLPRRADSAASLRSDSGIFPDTRTRQLPVTLPLPRPPPMPLVALAASASGSTVTEIAPSVAAAGVETSPDQAQRRWAAAHQERQPPPLHRPVQPGPVAPPLTVPIGAANTLGERPEVGSPAEHAGAAMLSSRPEPAVDDAGHRAGLSRPVMWSSP
jgi:hypothetical protein